MLGWAKFLGLGLLVFSAIQLFFFVFNLLYIRESEPFTLIIMFIFLVLTFISGFQLLSQHQNFIDSMCAMIVLFAYINSLVLLKGIYSGIIILLYYMGFDKFVEPVSGNLYEIVLFSLQSIISIVICLIVASYIINSKRISVTFCHRILADDPYLH